MDPDLTRLCAIPGNDDLTTGQAEDVLQLSRNTLQRLTSGNSPKIETKRHDGRGDGSKSRVRIPRAALVRYLVISSRGERAVILAAIKAQCPQYLPAVADLMPGSAVTALPANVIPFHKTRRRGDPETGRHEHPDQLQLFPQSA